MRNATKCRKCGGEMAEGVAMFETFSGVPDFIGGEVVTISAGGPGRIGPCLKCAACGYSTTIPRASCTPSGVQPVENPPV